MKIKKFEARTEEEAIGKVKAELGLGALILSVRKTKRKGIFSFLFKPIVEITAAYDDLPKAVRQEGLAEQAINEAASARQSTGANQFALASQNTQASIAKVPSLNKQQANTGEQQRKITDLENKLTSQGELLDKLMRQLSLAEQLRVKQRKYDNRMIQVFYDTLVEQGVTPEITERVLEDANALEDDSRVDINLISKIVYNKIISILGPAEPIETVKTRRVRFVVLMGPTGVGKTTTIAKISSILMLYHNLKVGLITADTYRIAAIEQLKTYAEILGLDVGVIYGSQDLENHLDPIVDMNNDVVLIDTAGRSHKNKENLKDLVDLLNMIPDATKYLVLSMTTKYEDMLNIVNTYSAMTDFKLVFTKLDETSLLGAILNICWLTGKRIAYVTNGQNVPDDIEVAHPEIITKALLGIGG
ncbi:MAG: flagellar biosynthesis protein FlhF [Clostridiales bacterium]|jgi:flagellar biosynthesis protein FlhF|nr:flagellar biosynthesis protein FlhF [Clostridiales bacterium]